MDTHSPGDSEEKKKIEGVVRSGGGASLFFSKTHSSFPHYPFLNINLYGERGERVRKGAVNLY